MKRPSSVAQLALIDLAVGAPVPMSAERSADAAARPKARRVSSWKQAQAAHNALLSEQLLATLAAQPSATVAGGPLAGTADGPHAADRPHPADDAPHAVIEWHAEALADLFEAVERAAQTAGRNDFVAVRRKAG